MHKSPSGTCIYVYMYIYAYVCIYIQCPKLRFYFVHPLGALLLKLCTRDFLHALFYYVVMINSQKSVHTPGAHLRKSCTRPRKCARRAQGAPLISDTEYIYIYIYILCMYIWLYEGPSSELTFGINMDN